MLNNSSSKRQLEEGELEFPSSHPTESSSPPPPAKKVQLGDKRQHQPVRRCIVCQSATKSKFVEATDELFKAVIRLQSVEDPAVLSARGFGGAPMKEEDNNQQVHQLCKRKVWAAVKKLNRKQVHYFASYCSII